MSKNRKSIYIITVALSVILVLPVLPTQAQVERYFFEFTIIAPLGMEARIRTAEIYKAELLKIGIKVNIELMDFATMTTKIVARDKKGATFKEGGIDAYLHTAGGGGLPFNPDPDQAYINWHSDPVNAPFRWSNARADDLLEMGGTTLDFEKRKEYYQEFSRIFSEELPAIPIWYTVIPYVMRKELENIDTYFGDATHDFRIMKIKGKTETDDTRVIYATPSEVKGFTEMLPSTGYDRRFHNILYDGLIDRPSTMLDPKYLKPLPGLAESWEESPDHLTYTLHLRRGVKWHDGVEFTSEDIKIMADGILDPKTAALPYKIWTEYVKSVEAPDKYTVVFRLKKPSANVWYSLFYYGRVLPGHILKDVPHKDWINHALHTSNPIGTGPYKFVKYVKGEYVEFKAFDDYWGGRPFVDHVFFKIIPEKSVALMALEKNEVQILEGFYGYDRELKNLNPDLTYQVTPFHNSIALHINTVHPILSNKWVRQAISYAIPREHIVKDVLAGVGNVASQLFYSKHWFADPNLTGWPYDIEKAKTFMEKAGFNYEWLKPPPEIPITTYLLPALGGIITGAVAVAIIDRVRRKPQTKV